MAPACADVDHSQNIVHLAESLVAGHADAPRGGQNNEEGEENHSNQAPDHVKLTNPVESNSGLRLVESDFNDAPSNSVQRRLGEDEVSQPSVEEVEALIR